MRDIEMTGKRTRIAMTADGLLLVHAPANDSQQVLRNLRNLQQQRIRLRHLQRTTK
jgi:hypothetical protein